MLRACGFVVAAGALFVAFYAYSFRIEPSLEQSLEPSRLPSEIADFEKAGDRLDEPAVKTSGKSQVTLTAGELRPKSELANGFVASKTCLECHPNEHHSWHASFHRTMTQVIDPDSAPAAITDKDVVLGERRYRFDKDGAEFFVTFADPLLGGQIVRRQLLMMTGSHHMHVFWYESDLHGAPGQLDIVFLKGDNRWIPRDSSFLLPPDMPEALELGTWNRTCSRCHSTHPRELFNPTTEDWDTRVAEFGISCEACHGEGEGHAKLHARDKTGEIDVTAIVDSIVNPAKLSKKASSDVCGQCHSVFMPDYDVLTQSDYMRDGNPFRPGQLLTDKAFTKVVRASAEQRDTETFKKWSSMEHMGNWFWSDGMPRIVGREYNGLIESPCFQHGEMTCLSCHEMHPSESTDLTIWRDDQLKLEMREDASCLHCHEDFSDRIAEHTHHAVDSHGSRCMNCHMPHTTYGLLKTVRSHQISSPTIEASRTSDRANACSLCHLDRGFQWVAGYLHDWYKQPELKQEPGEQPPPVSTSVLHLLSGDAAQRAVQVAAMGWKPAQEASGTDWMEPFLLLGLNDPYDAVRIVAAKSLATLPERHSSEIDPLETAENRMNAFNDAISIIDDQLQLRPRPEVLINEEGRFDFLRARSYLDQRNHQPVHLRE